jgi:pectate lyase
MRITGNLWPAFCLATAAFALPVAATSAHDLGRSTLHPQNGWGAYGAGVTGGSAATMEQTYVVTNRQELIAALNNGVYPPPSSTPSNEPKIIYVSGTIDANVDDTDQPLACADYYRNGYTVEAFLATYDPAVWGRVPPTGPLEDARIASRNAQQARVRVRVGSNTTIVGLDRNALIKGAWFDIRGTANVANSRSNIIVRNLTFRDTYDCFPEWSPTDGVLGSWNAQYDSISLRDTNNVWIDHNQFEDCDTKDANQLLGRTPECCGRKDAQEQLLGRTPECCGRKDAQEQPNHFGVLYQVHDGLLDITNASDLVTVSWNRFREHDKTMLIGSSDSAVADRGKLRVTLHHNVFERIGQRAPRVRFGQVHLYNNYYDLRSTPHYQYSWGVGSESAVYAEENFFLADRPFTPDQIIERFNGTALSASGTLLIGPRVRNPVDVVAAWNAVNAPDLGFDVGWMPTLNHELLPSWTTPLLVPLLAGPVFK